MFAHESTDGAKPDMHESDITNHHLLEAHEFLEVSRVVTRLTDGTPPALKPVLRRLPAFDGETRFRVLQKQKSRRAGQHIFRDLSHETPHRELAHIAGYTGFYWGWMDAWLEDGVEVPGPREIPGRIDASNQLEALFPQLAREWHPSRNAGIKPYEFAPTSNALVWWRDARGDEWQARIKDRVLEATRLRADGDATPYG